MCFGVERGERKIEEIYFYYRNFTDTITVEGQVVNKEEKQLRLCNQCQKIMRNTSDSWTGNLGWRRLSKVNQKTAAALSSARYSF